jgi:hypothetical protein
VTEDEDRIKELEGTVAELQERLRTIARLLRGELGIELPDVLAS